MRCKTCHYSLAKLTPTESGGHRCPECGRAYDSKDSTTFDIVPPESNWPEGVLLCLIAIAIGFSLYAESVFHPNRYPSGLGMLVGLPTICVLLLLLAVRMHRRRLRRPY